MTRKLLALFLCAALFPAAQYNIVAQPGDTVTVTVPASNTPPPIPPSKAKAPIGFNLDRPWESARDGIFTNLRYLSRFTAGAQGADGWPAGDFNLRVISNEDAGNAGTGVHYPKDTGEYLFQAKGKGTVYCAGASLKNLQTDPSKPASFQSFDPATGITTAIITRTDSTQNMDVGMRGTPGPVTGINIWRPGYHNATQMFTNEVLAGLSKGVVARLMNSMETNVHNLLLASRAEWTKADGILQWAERPKETDPFYTGAFGLPLEVCLKLCVAAGVSPYINFSNYTDEDYWREAAKLCKQIIPAGTPIYLAYSNETWQDTSRPDFWQGELIRKAAQTYTGTPSLNDPRYGAANYYYAGQRYTLAMAYRISDIFRTEYGDAEMGKTIRVVFECQAGNPALASDTLAWANAVYPKPPAHYLYMYMIAPYYGSGSIAGTGTDAQIIDGIYAGQASKINFAVADPWANWEMRAYSTARTYGLKAGCYENGLEIGGPSNRANKFKVCYSPQSKGFTTTNVAVVLSQGFELYIQYKMTSAYGAYTHGATDDISVLTNPRFEALAEAAATDPRRFELAMFDRASSYYGVAPSNAVLGNGTGLRGTYTYTEKGAPKTLVRTDPVINLWYLNYDNGNAVPRLDVLDNATKSWGCTWEGQFIPEYTGEHKFTFEGKWASLGVMIDGKPTTTMNLTAGVAVPIKITFASLDKEGKIRALVTPPDGRKRMIKQSQLVPS